MKILALGAHPDDVEVSAGGTIARFVAEGHEAEIRSTSHWYPADPYMEEASRAAETLGALYVPLDWGGDREKVKVYAKSELDLIIAPHPIHDSHPDHRHAGSIAQQIARKNNTDLWFMDHAIPGGWVADRPRPNHFVDITEYANRKMYAIREYKQWHQKYGDEWLDSIRWRDSYYGSILGVFRAEGFTIGFSRQ